MMITADAEMSSVLGKDISLKKFDGYTQEDERSNHESIFPGEAAAQGDQGEYINQNRRADHDKVNLLGLIPKKLIEPRLSFGI